MPHHPGLQPSLQQPTSDTLCLHTLDCQLTHDWTLQFFAESPYPGITLKLTNLVVTTPAAVGTRTTGLPANITDLYSPCILPQTSSNDAVYEVSLPKGTNDVLDATLCSPGGYLQVGCLLCCQQADWPQLPPVLSLTTPVRSYALTNSTPC